jgi:hypothetical protein
MAEWTYLDGMEIVAEGFDQATNRWGHIIADDVSPEHGPLIAAAPALHDLVGRYLQDHELMRARSKSAGFGPCPCTICRAARDVLAQIDGGVK